MEEASEEGEWVAVTEAVLAVNTEVVASTWTAARAVVEWVKTARASAEQAMGVLALIEAKALAASSSGAARGVAARVAVAMVRQTAAMRCGAR